jgi:hypothetical protein
VAQWAAIAPVARGEVQLSQTLAPSGCADRGDTKTASSPQRGQRKRSWFAVGTAAFVTALSILGFAPATVETATRFGPPSALVVAHGVVAAAWLLLFLAQAILVKTGHTRLHRRLGIAGSLLGCAMAALIVPTVTHEATRGYDFSGDLLRGAFPPGSLPPLDVRVQTATVGMLPPLLGTLNFTLLIVAGVWYRRRPEIHSRLMLLSLLLLAFVPVLHLGGHLVAHWPSRYRLITTAVPILGNALLFVVAARDWIAGRRIHPVSLWVPIALILEGALVIGLLAPSPAWRHVADWLVR